MNFFQEVIHNGKPADVWLAECSDCGHEWMIWLEVGEPPGWAQSCPVCDSPNTVARLESENKIMPTPSEAAARVKGGPGER